MLGLVHIGPNKVRQAGGARQIAPEQILAVFVPAAFGRFRDGDTFEGSSCEYDRLIRRAITAPCITQDKPRRRLPECPLLTGNPALGARRRRRVGHAQPIDFLR